MSERRSWYSGLNCSRCSRRVLVNAEAGGFFRATFTANGNVATSEAVCGACRREQLGNAVAQFGEAA